jgi:hypothetical protein
VENVFFTIARDIKERLAANADQKTEVRLPSWIHASGASSKAMSDENL